MDNIAEISKALCKIQAVLEGAKKSSDNPYFKSKYADLAEVWDVLREPLTSNGISVWQLPTTEYPGVDKKVIVKDTQDRNVTHKEVVITVPFVAVTTIITHISGEQIQNVFRMLPNEDSPQAIGGCITYARRYALISIFGVSPEDDDGNSNNINANRDRYDRYEQKEAPRNQPNSPVNSKQPIAPDQTKRAPVVGPPPIKPPEVKPSEAFIFDKKGIPRYDKNKQAMNDPLQVSLGLITTPMYNDIKKTVNDYFGGNFKDFCLWLKDTHEVEWYDIPQSKFESLITEISTRK